MSIAQRGQWLTELQIGAYRERGAGGASGWHDDIPMESTLPPADAEPPRLLGGLLVAWAAFWLMLFLVGLKDYHGHARPWEPLADYGTAALLSTLMAAILMRRASRIDALLRRPLRWFLRMWQWMPLDMVVFVSALEATHVAVRWAAGAPLRFWTPLDFAYEAGRFLLFYALFGGIHFGLRSYKAWANERLRAEHQARLAQAAQLAQLTQQLQPHFLFNALNTVSALIHVDPVMADALLTKLAALLRAATDASQRPQHALSDELVLLRAYADIMVQRFAERVEVGWEIDERALGCLVPTLGLQPLLENCFRHVVERRRAPTRLSVRARRGAEVLRLEVEDDGRALATPLVFGVGLRNLQQRLVSLHGDRARLVLEPHASGGLLVRVELPCAC